MMDESAASLGPKAKATKDRIAAAAARILIEDGPDRLTHRRVATASGSSLGSVTKYFSSIEELKRAGYERLSHVIDEDYRTMLQVASAAGNDIEQTVRALYARLEDPDNARADIALHHAALFDSRLRSMTAEAAEAFESSLAELIGREQALAASIYIDGLVLRTCTHGEPPSVEHIAHAIKALLSIEEAPLHLAARHPLANETQKGVENARTL